MKRVWQYIIMSIAGISCLAPLVHAADEALSADEIVTRANHMAFYQGSDGKANVTMTIVDGQGRERSREFTILRRNTPGEGDGEQKFYVYFRQPADVRNMVFMVWKHVNGDDDRWLYLPALDLVKRIAATDKRTSFAGSNFLYEDVSGRSTEEDTHTLTETTDSMYIVDNIPKDPASVEFSHYTVAIDKKTFMPLSIKYYDGQGNHYRTIEALDVQDIGGFPTVVKSKASDLASGGYTVSEFSNVGYDVGLDDSIFTERYLRQAPRRWIR